MCGWAECRSSAACDAQISYPTYRVSSRGVGRDFKADDAVVLAVPSVGQPRELGSHRGYRVRPGSDFDGQLNRTAGSGHILV